jgi:hypothetical protein
MGILPQIYDEAPKEGKGYILGDFAVVSEMYLRRGSGSLFGIDIPECIIQKRFWK